MDAQSEGADGARDASLKSGAGSSHTRTYLWSWAIMIVFTLAAFLAVGYHVLPKHGLAWLLGVLAGIQIVLQVVLFMHLRARRSWYVVYFAMGAGFAVVWVFAIWYLVWEVG